MLRVSMVLIGFSTVLLGCARESPEAAQVEPVAVVAKAADTSMSALPMDALKNAPFPSDYVDGGVVRLDKGLFQSSPDPEFGTQTRVEMSSWAASGDLNGDGNPDSVVVLVTDTGGSGVFYDMAAVLNENGKPGATQSIHLGDRVDLKTVKVQGGVIQVDMIEQGPDDPGCCPSQLVSYQYRLEGGSLLAMGRAESSAG